MLRINHWDQIETVPDPNIQGFLRDRQQLLTTDGEYDPEEDGGFLIVEAGDDVHRDFPFIGTHGLFSDLFEEHPPFTDGFASPFEYAFHHPQFALHELYLQLNDTRCVVILIPDAVVEAHPDLKRLLDELSVEPTENPR